MANETTDQAPEQSVEDRIYAKFDNSEQQEAAPEPEEAEEQSEAPEPEEAEVEYEGERYRVPKKLEKAILQEADYTRKTQEIAKQRQLLEQSQANAQIAMMEKEFHDSVQDEVHNLKVMDNYIKQLRSQNFNDMTTEDGFRQWMVIQQATEQRDQLSKQIESRQKEFRSKFESAIAEAKAKSHEFLAKNINGYTPESFKAVREYGKTQGFPEPVLDSIEADPKAASVLYKAMRFDQLQEGKTSAVQKLNAPVVKPGSSRPMPQEVKEKLNFRKQMNGAKTSQEKAKLIEQRLAATTR